MDSKFSREHAEELLKTLKGASQDRDFNWRALHAVEAAAECQIRQAILISELLEEVRQIRLAMPKP